MEPITEKDEIKALMSPSGNKLFSLGKPGLKSLLKVMLSLLVPGPQRGKHRLIEEEIRGCSSDDFV